MPNNGDNTSSSGDESTRSAVSSPLSPLFSGFFRQLQVGSESGLVARLTTPTAVQFVPIEAQGSNRVELDLEKVLTKLFTKKTNREAWQSLEDLIDALPDNISERDRRKQVILDLQTIVSTMKSLDTDHELGDKVYPLQLPQAHLAQLRFFVREYLNRRHDEPRIEIIIINLEPDQPVQIGHEVIHDLACELQASVQDKQKYYSLVTQRAHFIVSEGIEIALSTELKQRQFENQRTSTFNLIDPSSKDANQRYYQKLAGVLERAVRATEDLTSGSSSTRTADSAPLVYSSPRGF